MNMTRLSYHRSFVLVLATFALLAGEICAQRADTGAEVTCNATTMRVSFNITKIEAYGRPFRFHFNGQSSPGCSNITNATQSNVQGDIIFLEASYNECGINVTTVGNEVIYSQQVILTYGKQMTQSNLVYREESDHYHVQCKKSRNFTSTLMDTDGHINVTALKVGHYNKTGQSNFDVTLKRFDSTYAVPDTSGTASLGDTLYFSLQLTTPRNDLMLSPLNCYSTKADGTGKYFLIQNKCASPEDRTVRITSSPSDTKVFKWSNEAFRYYGNSDAIFIQCDVIICHANSTAPECSRCALGGIRGRRDVSSPSTDEFSLTNEDIEAMTVRAPMIILLGEKGTDLYADAKVPAPVKTGFLTDAKGITIVTLVCLLSVSLIYVFSKKFKVRAAVQNPGIRMTSVETQGIENMGMDRKC